MAGADAEDTQDLPAIPRPSVVPSVAGDAPVLVVAGPKASVFRLRDSAPTLIGRGAAVDVRLGDPSASREHCLVTREGNDFLVRDLGSRHGTLVDGRRVEGTETLPPEAILTVGRTAIQLLPTLAGLPRGRQRLGDLWVFMGSPATQTLHAELTQLAPMDLPVLVLGETGTGKEIVARTLHASSPRSGGPFVTVNCAALPESLVESELFGHERGAFSGADAARVGVVEAAHGGTLFLDEVGELPTVIQAKLLRVLEARVVQRLGDGARERPVQVRVVSATNASLGSAGSSFRRDLYFRLAGATVVLPPLRERALDVVALARGFLVEDARRSGKRERRLDADALGVLLAHEWPGNVRELLHVVGRVAGRRPGEPVDARELGRALERPRFVPAGGRPSRGALDRPSLAPGAGVAFRPIDEEVRGLERARMAEALRATGGNRSRAAELIGMPRRTFLVRLKSYGLT